MINRREFSLGLMATAGALSTSRINAQGKLQVNGQRIMDHLKALSEFGKNPQGGVSRVAYSDADRDGREYVMGLMRDAKLEVSIDAAGNLSGRRPGTVKPLRPLLFGSHIDSVPEGGNYDGDVGSLAAIEVAQVLVENNHSTRHPIEVIVFQNEEGGLIGSRAIDGELTQKELDLVSRSGKTIGDGINFIGGNTVRLPTIKRERGDVFAYVELHIEQGGVLEAEKVDIGVVEGIVGIKWWDVTVEGFANHAGTTPMNKRQDALLASANFIQAVNRVVTSIPGRQVGTVGRIQAFPGAPNVIPGKVLLSLEIRDLDGEKIDMLYRKIVAESARIANNSGTKFEFKEINVNIPAPTDQRIRNVIDESAKELGLSTKLMPSGAGHDAQDMARIAPVGMIFIPSIGGISHSPKEYSRPEDIRNGANVLLNTILKLDALNW